MLSLGDIPLTTETRDALVASGVVEMPATEMGGQSLLVLAGVTADADAQPRCFARAFAPTSPRCLGCVFLPMCWPKDGAYLRRVAAGTEEPPPGVPGELVGRAAGAVAALPPPPPALRPLPPPPPPPPLPLPAAKR